jgi:hypothetical protein
MKKGLTTDTTKVIKILSIYELFLSPKAVAAYMMFWFYESGN